MKRKDKYNCKDKEKKIWVHSLSGRLKEYRNDWLVEELRGGNKCPKMERWLDRRLKNATSHPIQQ